MTTAIALWLLGSAGVALYVSGAAWAVAQGASVWWFIVAALPVALAAPGLLSAIYLSLAWIHRAPRPAEHRIGLARSLRLWASEAAAILVSWPRMALFRWLMREPEPAPATLPVILLHGVLCNAGVWRGFRGHLRVRGIAAVYTFTFEPPFASIERFAQQLAGRIDAVRAATGADKVVLVGHSMGGLVARAYLRRHGAGKVALLLTLGTPHHGSAHAWLFAGRCLAEMRPGNAWLALLNRDEGSPPPVRFVSLWSWHDSMVAPQTSSRYAGAVNVELEGIGHNALLGDPRVREAVAKELIAAQAAEIRRGLRTAET
jgi:triacylglycerol esterase/lipase EstA (alpha/beta hydrolase family)